MKYLIFKNNGEVSPQEMNTFGMSIKSEGAIGFFGTGFKYAVAISVRLNDPIQVYSGLTRYRFTKQTETVRGKTFDFINMESLSPRYDEDDDPFNSERMGFTTHVGAKWEPWMCIREVLCNCLDEGGTFYYSDELPEPAADTTFVVMSGLFVDIPLEEYTLPGNRALIMSNKDIDIYNARSAYVYYKGIRVEDKAKPYRYTYNIKSQLTLGEDRLAHPYYIGHAICTPIIQSEHEELIRYVIQAGEETGEGKFQYSVHNLSIYGTEKTKSIVRQIHKRDGSLSSWAKEAAPTLLTDDDHLELVKEADLTDDQTEAFAQAITMIAKYFPISDYKLRVVSMSEGYYGKAYINKKMILLNANQLGSENVDQIKMTILEEYLHIRFEAADYGRAWQDGALRMMLELIEQCERKDRE
jgi:hypothetical protein